MENQNVEGDDSGNLVQLAPVSTNSLDAGQQLLLVETMQWVIEDQDIEMFIQMELTFFSRLVVYDQQYDARVMNLFRVTRIIFERTLDENVKAAKARLIILKKHMYLVYAWTEERKRTGMSTELLDIKMSPEELKEFEEALKDYDILMGKYFLVKETVSKMYKKQSEIRAMQFQEMVNSILKVRFLKIEYDNLWVIFHDCENKKKEYEQKIISILHTNGVEEIGDDVFQMSI